MPLRRSPGPGPRPRPAALLVLAAALALSILAAASPAARAEPSYQGGPGEQLFQSKCTACHTIGKGKLVGPDLEGVTARRDPAWLKRMIADPESLFAAGDPTAQQLLAEANNVKMPALGLAPADVDALVAYLSGFAAAGAATQPAAVPQPAQPAVVGDPLVGKRLFRGETAFAAAGPACMACHSVDGASALGGGALGPDLTHVVQRYPGPGLGAVLGNIAFPTMAGPFANRPLTAREQADLVAFLAQADKRAAQPPVTAGALTADTGRWLGLGAAGMLALMFLLAFFWPRQRRGMAARLRAAHRTPEV